MINFKKDGVIFNYRVAGVSIHNGKILFHRKENGSLNENVWTLPGGRVELAEDSATSLAREYLEEMSCSVEVGRLLWFIENFFEHKGEYFHEVLPIYIVEIPKDSDYLDQEEFYGVEGDKKLIFRWMPLDEVMDMEIYPLCLREILDKIPENTERIVNREVEHEK